MRRLGLYGARRCRQGPALRRAVSCRTRCRSPRIAERISCVVPEVILKSAACSKSSRLASRASHAPHCRRRLCTSMSFVAPRSPRRQVVPRSARCWLTSAAKPIAATSGSASSSSSPRRESAAGPRKAAGAGAGEEEEALHEEEDEAARPPPPPPPAAATAASEEEEDAPLAGAGETAAGGAPAQSAPPHPGSRARLGALC